MVVVGVGLLCLAIAVFGVALIGMILPTQLCPKCGSELVGRWGV